MCGIKIEWDNSKPLLRQCLVTANVGMTLVGHGCVIGISAILIPSLREPESHIHATVSEESWIAAALGPALTCGNLLITFLLDVLGRKKCHFLTVLPVLVGWFVLLLAKNVAGLIAARLLQGVALGIYGSLGSIIIGEMTDPKNRGMFLTTISLALTIGVLFSHALGTYFTWQMSTLICSFTTFTSLLMLFHTPESPSWLISKGRYEEAREIFFWLRGNGEEEEIEYQKMVAAHKMIQKSSAVEQNGSFFGNIGRSLFYFKETCRKPEFFKPITIMICLYIMFQFAGINVISSYTTDIIEQVVGPEANSKLLMVVLDVERLVCNLLAVYFMKIMKRRLLLFSTGFICVLSYFGQAAYVYLRRNDLIADDRQWIPIGLISIYMFTLTVGISSVPFAIAGEIFPLQYRGLGSGISLLFLSLNFSLAVKCFPVLISAIGLCLTYIVYASIVAVCLCVAWFLLPETKDKTLQDIEDTFRGYSSDLRSSEPLNGRNDSVA